MGRYTSRPRLKNNSTLYHEVLEKRGVQHIIQYDTAKFKSLNSLKLSVQTHIWQKGR